MWIVYLLAGLVALGLLGWGVIKLLELCEEYIWVTILTIVVLTGLEITGLGFLFAWLWKDHRWAVYLLITIAALAGIAILAFLFINLWDFFSYIFEDISIWWSKKKKKHNTEQEIELPIRYKRKYLLTKREWSFYHELKLIANKHNYIVLAKIRMADLVEPDEPKGSKGYFRAFSKTKAKHIDFALCNPVNMYVELLIELDDSTHERADRKERDLFIEKVYEETGYKLLRVIDTEGLENKLIEALKK